MPITPFHFGPALLVKGVVPRWFSWTAFVASQIVIDLESLYFLTRHQYPVHRSLHTLVGATLAGVGTAIVLLGLRALASRGFGPGALEPRFPRFRYELAPHALAVGALVGGISHPLLDGLMHSDVRPFGPWSDANPWLGAVSLDVLHDGCLIAGVAGGVILALRGWRASRQRS